MLCNFDLFNIILTIPSQDHFYADDKLVNYATTSNIKNTSFASRILLLYSYEELRKCILQLTPCDN